MVQLGDIIEIESSPEPTTHKSREKGKGKATPYRLELASSVIEITDSESEADEAKASTSPGVGPSRSNSHAGPSPSSPKRTYVPNLKSYPTRPIGTLVHISTPPASDSGSGTEACPTKQNLNGHVQNPPLFLSGDEEHEPPAQDTAHIGRVEAGAASTSVIEREHNIPIPETQSRIPTRPTAFDSDPIPIEEKDLNSTAVAQILEIIPDVDPTHLLQLIETNLPTYSVFRGDRDPDADGGEGAAGAGGREATLEEQVQGVVGHVLHILFENPDFPKADLRVGGKKRVGDSDDEDDLEGKGKGKGKARESSKKPKIDYASIDRPFSGGPNYFDLALVCPFLH
jgi:TRIAD3 protein (E3 ubiquitin-protein ligase RNF216)